MDSLMSSGNRALSDLPYEVVEQILSCKEVSYIDICRVSEVCHKLHDVVNSSRLWHVKFCQEWDSLTKLYGNHHVDWKEEYQQRYKYGRHVQKLVAAMCEQASFYGTLDNSFSAFKNLSEGHQFASHFMLDEMELILYDGRCYSNLTTKFYCSKLLHYARQNHLKKIDFRNFLEKEDNLQTLEIGACLIAQFCQPVEKINFESIAARLDDIAEYVKTAVKQVSPKHPVLAGDLIPSCTVLDKSLWSPSDCRVILTCLNTTLFHNLQYTCIYEYEGFSSDQILIDKVLEGKVGIPVAIAIIYASVAHRLGVHCKLCEPGNTAVKWLEHPMLDKTNMYTFVDVTSCGKLFTFSEFAASMQMRAQMEAGEEFPAKSPSQVFKDVAQSLSHIGGRNLHLLEERLLYESTSLELDLIFSPNNKEKILMLIHLYLQMYVRLFEVKDLLTHFTAADPPYISYRVTRLRVELESRIRHLSSEHTNQKPEKKLREKCPTVSFAVGMIMKHKKYDYICVIYGWDKICRASDHWIQQMRVFELRNKSSQPFYNVLVEDGTQRYAAQENLEICDSPRFINHPDVGKYFEEFKNTHFVPNEMTNAEYPEDNDARGTILQNFFASHETPASDV